MEYNPFSLQIHLDPYPIYKYLRDYEPLYHNTLNLNNGQDISFWALTRFQDVWDATLDWERFSSSAGPALEIAVMVPMMIAMDPPEHNLNRGIISKSFTPRAVEKLEPQIRDIICGYGDELQQRDQFDVVKDFSAKFPMDVISSMLGIPKEDRDWVRENSNQQLTRTPGDPMPPMAAIEAGAKNWNYFSEQIDALRKQNYEVYEKNIGYVHSSNVRGFTSVPIKIKREKNESCRT